LEDTNDIHNNQQPDASIMSLLIKKSTIGFMDRVSMISRIQ